jgi:hypothetical protein
MDFAPVLADPRHPDFEKAWNTFFLDVSLVQNFAAQANSEVAKAVLLAGQQWTGSGWNTSKASKTLWSLTGVPLVKAAWVDYRTAFLYALSLLLEVEVLELDLNDRVSDAAFELLKVFTGQAAPYSGQVGMHADLQTGDPG